MAEQSTKEYERKIQALYDEIKRTRQKLIAKYGEQIQQFWNE